jgi:N-sulfoglucosamine sulfohydrolase
MQMKNLKIFSILILMGYFFAGCMARQSSERQQSKKPNIVFLFSDDQSSPDLGAYGNTIIKTPNLDRLAEEGVLFKRAYVTTAQCSPSRASILTGRSAHAVGASRLHINAQQGFTSLIEMLNDAGYFTGAYRKVHQQNIQSQFDFFGGNKEKLTTFFDQLPEDQPFFLWFGSRDPHRPYTSGKYEYQHDPATVIVPDYLPDTEAVREDLANYYNELTRFDNESGQIMDLLREKGLDENTIIVMSSDNGMPFPRAKGTCYEAGVHVPLIIKWPGNIKGGTVIDEMVSLIDLTPTWLEAAGIPVPEVMEGHSLIPLFNGDRTNKREYVFTERNWHDNWDPMRSVISEKYKLIQNYRPEAGTTHTLDRLFSPTWDEFERLQTQGKLDERLQYYFDETKPVIEFYDLENDPGEWSNLADDPEYAELIDQHQQALANWMNNTHDFLPSPRDAFPQGRGFNKKYDVLDAEEFEKQVVQK